jgi:hypothetical protein
LTASAGFVINCWGRNCSVENTWNGCSNTPTPHCNSKKHNWTFKSACLWRMCSQATHSVLRNHTYKGTIDYGLCVCHEWYCLTIYFCPPKSHLCYRILQKQLLTKYKHTTSLHHVHNVCLSET